jgi:DNA repair exonuclease SbcCD ATPase subunit|tara:strand:+ start:1250 stop:1648 length:399 start_codon:yes stop_codon:yes gene_type:complete
MNLYELKQHAKKMSKAIYLAYPEKVADDVNTTVLALLEELQLLEHTLDASENHRVEIQQELDQLKQENQRLKDEKAEERKNLGELVSMWHEVAYMHKLCGSRSLGAERSDCGHDLESVLDGDLSCIERTEAK